MGVCVEYVVCDGQCVMVQAVWYACFVFYVHVELR